MPAHLDAQIEFLLLCDRLKQVRRTTYLHDASRPENSAEHSWHLALMALTLGEYAPAGTNLPRVVEILLVHDLVEIYAGDTYFDVSAAQQSQQAQNEAEAAAKLFSVLPDSQQRHLLGLWNEFEAQHTLESRFAKALDALQPVLLSWGKGAAGCLSRHPDLTAQRLLKLKEPRLQEFPDLWQLAQQTVSQAQAIGMIE